MKRTLFFALCLTLAGVGEARSCGLSGASYCPAPVALAQYAAPAQFALPAYQSYAAPVQFAAPVCPQVGLESYAPSFAAPLYGQQFSAFAASNYSTFGLNSYGLNVGVHRRRAVMVGERGVRVDVRRGVGRAKVKVRVRRRR